MAEKVSSSSTTDGIVKSYIAYSVLMGVLAVLLVAVLVLPDLPSPRESLSDYYNAGGWRRDAFVGTLCVVAFFLLLYRGLLGSAEAILLIIALSALLLSLCGLFIAIYEPR